MQTPLILLLLWCGQLQERKGKLCERYLPNWKSVGVCLALVQRFSAFMYSSMLEIVLPKLNMQMRNFAEVAVPSGKASILTSRTIMPMNALFETGIESCPKPNDCLEQRITPVVELNNFKA